MKLITLNIWAGLHFEPLIEFVKKHTGDIDIFCFQEVFHTETDRIVNGGGFRTNIHQELSSVLTGYDVFFDVAQEGIEAGGIKADYHIQFGLATFIKKSLNLKEHGETFVFRHKNALEDDDLRGMGRNIQYFTFDKDDETYSIINFHGLWNGKGKSDTEDRIEQSKKVKACMDGLPGRKILCGDFNLLPDTQSIAILEEGMRNLVKEYGVTDTRSSLYTKPLRFADYTLVSPDIEVKNFEVLQDVVSDHLPLLLEF